MPPFQHLICSNVIQNLYREKVDNIIIAIRDLFRNTTLTYFFILCARARVCVCVCVCTQYTYVYVYSMCSRNRSTRGEILHEKIS